MFEWVAPEKKIFFYRLLAAIFIEILLVMVIATMEHDHFGPLSDQSGKDKNTMLSDSTVAEEKGPKQLIAVSDIL